MNFTKPLTKTQVTDHLDNYFAKLQQKNPGRSTLVRVYSPSSGMDYTYPAGRSDSPYHIASIGKVFTAVLVQMLAARGKFSIDDPIHSYLPSGTLDRLFIFKQVDYQKDVTFRHLLGHTSGIADYFEGKTVDGKTLIKDVLENPDTHWTPEMLVNFTRERQKAVAAPGTKYNYSDTGYILLGLLIEAVTGKSFGQNLEDEFFRPLEMMDTYLMFHTRPLNGNTRPIEPIWFGDQEVSRFESLSCDWAGGGIVSTTDDLLKFDRALRENRLIDSAVLKEMDVCPNRFNPGIYYGLGMMEIRFGDFFFLLGSLPKVKGHIGILATHMFYDPVTDTHIVMNFGSTTRMVESFKTLIEIETLLRRLTGK
jgi:D-alanyl-D-alanine carboxypeptidase